MNGREYEATQVTYKANDAKVCYSLELAKAYPKEAQVKSWKRSLDFVRRKGLTVNECYELNSYVAPSSVQLMTTAMVNLRSPGKVELILDGCTYLLSFPASECDLVIDPIKVTDPVLIHNWGKQMNRLILRLKSKNTSGNFQYSIRY
jgi:hypothetical protein